MATNVHCHLILNAIALHVAYRAPTQVVKQQLGQPVLWRASDHPLR